MAPSAYVVMLKAMAQIRKRIPLPSLKVVRAFGRCRMHALNKTQSNNKKKSVNAGTKLNYSCWRTLDNTIKFAPLSLNFLGPGIL